MSGKPTHGDLVWMPNSGPNQVKIANRTWVELGREKKRMEQEFPKYYGNKKLGKLKLRYRQL